MTIKTQLTKAHFQGNGAATEWPLPFPVLQPEHVHIIETDNSGGEDTEITENYQVIGCGTDDVRVVFPLSGSPLAAGKKLTIYRALPFTQELDLENNAAFDAEAIETRFDNLVMQVQQIAEEVERSVKVAVTSEEEAPTAEEIYEQVDKIAGRAGNAVARAETAADRAGEVLEEVIGRTTLAKGKDNLFDLWTTGGAMTAGDILELPVGYHAGRNMLRLTWNGLPCFPPGPSTPGGLPQYREDGEKDAYSTRVRILFDAPAGSAWSAWVVASNVSRHQEELTDQAETAAISARRAADEAAAAKDDVLATIGGAATEAATGAAQIAVAAVREGLTGYVAAAQEARAGAEQARDEAGNKLAEVMRAASALEIAETSVNAACRTTETAVNAARTVTADAESARDNAQAAAESAGISARAAAESAAAAARASKGKTVFHSPANSRETAITAGTQFAVPPYAAGENVLEIFLNGQPCTAGSDASIHQYREIGTDGGTSAAIVFHDTIPTTYEIIARA